MGARISYQEQPLFPTNEEVLAVWIEHEAVVPGDEPDMREVFEDWLNRVRLEVVEHAMNEVMQQPNVGAWVVLQEVADQYRPAAGFRLGGER